MLRSLDYAKWDVIIQLKIGKADLSYGDVCIAMLLEYERRAAARIDMKEIS